LGVVANLTELTAKKRAAFCERLANGFSVTEGAKAIGVERATVYLWRKKEPEFAAQWEAALDKGTEHLEDEAVKRATEGKSDTLLIFLLKARRPNVYREKYEHKFDFSSSLARVLGEFRKLDSDGRAAVIAKAREHESNGRADATVRGS
jgi:hypothetical protein